MLALTLSSFRVFAAACDGLKISTQSALIDLNTQNLTPIVITVSRTATSGSCDFFITADNGPSSTYLTRKITKGTDSIPFQLYLDAGKTKILKSYTEASTSNDVIEGKLTGTSTGPITLTYYPFVDTTFSAPNGPYVESYGFYLYEGKIIAKPAVLRDNKSTNMKYTKSGFVELSLVDTGAVYNAADTSQTLNFGSLVTGAVRSFDLMLKYNGGYKLSMASTNGSVIKSGVKTIPYTMTLNSGAVTLTTTSTVVRTNASDSGGSATSPTAGLRLPVSVTIGTIGNVPTGTYSDTVAITVASP